MRYPFNKKKRIDPVWTTFCLLLCLSPAHTVSTPIPRLLNLRLTPFFVCMFDPISSIGSRRLAPWWRRGMHEQCTHCSKQQLPVGVLVLFFQIGQHRALSVWPFASKGCSIAVARPCMPKKTTMRGTGSKFFSPLFPILQPKLTFFPLFTCARSTLARPRPFISFSFNFFALSSSSLLLLLFFFFFFFGSLLPSP